MVLAHLFQTLEVEVLTVSLGVVNMRKIDTPEADKFKRHIIWALLAAVVVVVLHII